MIICFPQSKKQRIIGIFQLKIVLLQTENKTIIIIQEHEIYEPINHHDDALPLLHPGMVTERQTFQHRQSALEQPRYAGVPGQERIHLDSHPQWLEHLRWLPHHRNEEGYVQFSGSQ